MSHPPLFPALRLSSLFLCATIGAAASQLDLDRTKPVAPDQPIPTFDFYRPVQMQAPVINLAGSHIAAPILVAGQDQYALMVDELETKKVNVAGAPKERDVQSVWWLGDDHLLYMLNARKTQYDAFMAAPRKPDRNYTVIQGAGAQLVCIPYATPLHPLMWMAWGNETGHDEGVSAVDATLNTGPLIDLLSLNVSGTDFSDVKDRNIRHTLETYPRPPDGLTERYICDADDKLAFAINSHDGVETLYQLVGRSWEKCPVNLDEIEIVDAGDRPGELLVLGPRTGKPRPLQFMDAATGKLGEIVLQDPEYDFNGVIYRTRTTPHKIIGLRYQRNGPRVVWFNADMRAIQQILDAQFKGQFVEIMDWNQGMTRFVVGHYTDRQPVTYDWVDLEKKTAGPINESRPWLAASRMLPMNVFKFTTKDGRKLDAYLTLPAGTSPKHPVPLVVIPHGGPTNMRDTWGFDPDAQYFASRGYAVLKANYRGSPGYNWAFPLEDTWDYVKMSDDITVATNAVIRTKLIDRTRVAILGTQFGGYLAMMGAATEPSLYRCAVAINGIYDWSAYASQTKYTENNSPYHGWMMRRLGDPGDNQARYDAISPTRRANQIKAAVFIAWDKSTSPVEISEPHELIAALERNHVPHEDMLVNDDRHGLGYLDKQMEMHDRIEAFLAKYLGGP